MFKKSEIFHLKEEEFLQLFHNDIEYCSDCSSWHSLWHLGLHLRLKNNSFKLMILVKDVAVIGSIFSPNKPIGKEKMFKKVET